MRYYYLYVILLAIGLVLAGCSSNDAIDDSDDDSGNNTPGGEVWAANFTGNNAEEMEDVVLLSDGDLLVVGTLENYDTDAVDVWVVRYNPDGTIQWQKSYGGSGTDLGFAAAQANDGGFIVVGSTESFSNGSSDFWVIKLNSSGSVQWEKSYGGSGIEQAWSVDVTSDGGYIVAGGTTSYGAGGSDCLVLKLDANGDITWQKAFGGSGDEAGGGAYEEYVARVIEDEDGNFVVTAITLSFGYGDSDIWLFKLDSSGSVIWEYAYGDVDEDGIWMFREKEGGGGYIVPGYFTPTTDYDADLWVMQVNKDGSVAWQNTYGVSGRYDEALSIGAASDGGALLGGSYYHDDDSDWSLTLVRVDGSGNLDWSKKYEHGFDWANGIVEMPDGKFAIAGVTMESLDNQVDFLMMKTGSDGTIGTSCSELQDLSVSKEATSVTPKATAATVTGTNITPTETSATVEDTGASGSYRCTE